MSAKKNPRGDQSRPMEYREQVKPVRVKRRRPMKPTYKRWDYDKLVEAIRDYIEERGRGGSLEWFSCKFRAKRHLVQKAMYQMVREGLLYTPVNYGPHDCGRHPFIGGPGWSGWIATRWKYRPPSERKGGTPGPTGMYWAK